MIRKNLRSQIHENFPFDCRVELSVLQKRRDITNEEKQHELFGILSKYKINAVQLGCGTNRYAFKLNGYAIKFATNNDGRIDNFKEFKMSPLLQPHVIRCHEVSEDGILLVTEYIQPFDSFIELRRYENEIKKILAKLEEDYVFGDVGIVENNYANWGLRIGRDEPVCLDFAYVYDVSSEILLCNKCKARSMLTSTPDYSKLKCPSCGEIYLFEDIRRRIGNDLHNHEIGNLRDIGYTLTTSPVDTELDEKRSVYLKYKEDKKVKVKKEKNVKPEFIDDFHL